MLWWKGDPYRSSEIEIIIFLFLSEKRHDKISVFCDRLLFLLSIHKDRFHVMFCLNFYPQSLEILRAKTKKRQWKKLENLLLKHIAKPQKKKVISSVTLFYFDIGRKSIKYWATPWGWTFSFWKLLTFFIHIIIQKY